MSSPKWVMRGIHTDQPEVEGGAILRAEARGLRSGLGASFF